MDLEKKVAEPRGLRRPYPGGGFQSSKRRDVDGKRIGGVAVPGIVS